MADTETILKRTPKLIQKAPPTVSVEPTAPQEVLKRTPKLIQKAPPVATPLPTQNYTGGFRQLGNAPIPPKTGKTVDEVVNDPTAFTTVQDYMVKRKGKHILELPKEEVMDMFVSHMRYFQTNEVSTVGEGVWFWQQEDENRAAAGKAYGVYDSLGGMLSNDGVTGALGGVKDYGLAVLSSPSTYLGAILGKGVTMASTRIAATKLTQEAARYAEKKAIQEVMRKGGSLAAANAAGDVAKKQVVKEAAEGIAAKNVKKDLLKSATVGAAVDTGMSFQQDRSYQNIQIASGNQDEFSELQSAIATASGLIGGIVPYVPEAARAISGLRGTKDKLAKGIIKQRDAAQAKMIPAATKMVKTFAQEASLWNKAAQEGAGLTDSAKFQQQVVDALLGTGEDGQEGLLQTMLTEAGVVFDKTADAPRVMDQAVAFTRGLPNETKAELDLLLKPALGIGFDDMINVMAKTLKEGGTSLGLASKFGKNIDTIVKANREVDLQLAQEAIDNQKLQDSPDVLGYVQNQWKRALVSHPATTAVNVKGWAIVNMFDTAAQIADAALSTTAWGIASAAPGQAAKKVAKVAKNRAWAEASNLVFKARTLFDPYSTKESMDTFFKDLPARYKKMVGESTFGVDTRGPADYGVNPRNPLVKRAEGLLNGASVVSGMQIQDALTKSLSVMGEIDRLTRIYQNKGIGQMLEEGLGHTIPDELWKRAIEKGLKDTFSMDYTKGKSPLHQVAKGVETLSNLPGVGFLFPFGRFMNNAMAFQLKYSPLAFFPLVNQMAKKGIMKGGAHLGSEEGMSQLTKATVGTLAIWQLMKFQTEQEKLGLAWNQQMDGTGQIVNNDNLSPLSAYQVLGRIGSLMERGEMANAKELLSDAGVQLIIGQLTKQLDNTSGLKEGIQYLLSLNDDDQGAADYGKMLLGIGNFMSGVGAGFLRPLEPLNAAIKGAIGDTRTVDRNQLKGAEKLRANLFRYVDVLFSQYELPPQHSITKEGPLTEPNLMAKLAGRREELPITDADRMLNIVNLPPWTQQERSGIPTHNAEVNAKLGTLLNQRAAQVMKRPAWVYGSQRSRYLQVKTLLTELKADAREMVAGSSWDANTRNEQRKWLSQDENFRIEAKKFFKLEDIPDDKLTIPQIEMMKYWIKETRNSYKQ